LNHTLGFYSATYGGDEWGNGMSAGCWVGKKCSVARAMWDHKICCGIISSWQSDITSEIVKRFWSQTWLGAIAISATQQIKVGQVLSVKCYLQRWLWQDWLLWTSTGGPSAHLLKYTIISSVLRGEFKKFCNSIC